MCALIAGYLKWLLKCCRTSNEWYWLWILYSLSGQRLIISINMGATMVSTRILYKVYNIVIPHTLEHHRYYCNASITVSRWRDSQIISRYCVVYRTLYILQYSTVYMVSYEDDEYYVIYNFYSILGLPFAIIQGTSIIFRLITNIYKQ